MGRDQAQADDRAMGYNPTFCPDAQGSMRTGVPTATDS